MTLATRIRLDMIGPSALLLTDSATASATDRGWWVVRGAAAYVALFFLWTEFHWGSEQYRALIADLAFLPLKIALVVLFWRTAFHPALPPRLRWGWQVLTLTMLCYGIANAVLWPYYELVQAQQPYPSWTDGGYADHYPYVLYGFILFTVHPSLLLGLILVAEFHEKGRLAWLKLCLDAGIVLVGAGAPVWYFLVRPIAEAYRYDLSETLVFLAYPVSPLLLLFGALMVLLIGSGPRNKMSLQSVALGVLVLCAGEMAFTYQTLQNDYRSGDPVDALYAVADLLLMIGAQLEYVRVSVGSSEVSPNRFGDFFKILPYLAVMLAYGLLLGTVGDDWREPLSGLIVAAVVLTTLLLGRQFIANRENLRLRAEQDQHESEARFAALVRKSSDLVTIADPYGVIQFVSPAVQNMLGYEPDSLHQTPLLALLHPEDQHRGRDFFRDTLRDAGATAAIEWRMRCRDGSWLHVETVASNLRSDPLVQGIVLNSRNVSERRALEEQLRQLAFQDSLTRLANRVLFRDRVQHALERAQRSGQPVAVMFLDLDNFKTINDSLGHGEGDRLLVATARQLVRHTRASDTVARLGGDEFTLLLPEIKRSEDAAIVAERIQANLSQPLNLGGHEVFVTPSIGIAVFPKDGEDAETLLKNADMAMYLAKRQGRNLYRFYDATLNEAAIKRLTMENQLRKAIERNELSLHYQPQLDLPRSCICGVEALVRWTNELLGTVSPAELIPLAEETGLIVPIGEWVLRAACRQAKAWRVAGIGLERIAVNISVLQFVQPGFTGLVAQILTETGLEPEVLELEITESLLMKDPEGALHTLRTLKSLGVQLAIDDFGTGYSSLSRLKQLPLDRLKIDKVFVRDVNSQPNDAAIATAVIAMAGSMGLRVIAEGVENEAQLRFLESKHCNEIQGYYLSRPLPTAEMTAMLRELRAGDGDG